MSTRKSTRVDALQQDELVTSSQRNDPDQPGQLLYLVKHVEQAIRAHLDALVRPLGLTRNQYTALSVLERRDDLSSVDLARRSFVRPRTMHEMIKSLDERGFIERHRDPDSRRVLRIRLTAKGRSMLERYGERVRLLQARMLATLSARQRQNLHDALTASQHSLATRD
jgi:DNA-binding MarR family transcriptional regulator